MAIHIFKRSSKLLLLFVLLFTLLWCFYLFPRTNKSQSIEEPIENQFGQDIYNHPKALFAGKNAEINDDFGKPEIPLSDLKSIPDKMPEENMLGSHHVESPKQFGSNSHSNEKFNDVPKNQQLGKQKPNDSNNHKNGTLARSRLNQTGTKNGLKVESVVKHPTQKKRYPNYYEDNLHPNWTFKTLRHYDESHLRYWTEPIRWNRTDTWTQGENGEGFRPSNDDEKALMEKIQHEHNYNIFASERISLHRSIPDYRFPECRNLSYPDKLPTVSVIIVVHNEAWSTLLRTVWSIIDRSPRELLEEIILVDDVSTWPFLKRPLDDYVEMLPVKVKIIRTDQREGLIRARIIGAKNATGSVLTFLDAHMECGEGWLQPTLARIADDRSVVAVPLLGSVSSGDMGYSGPSSMEITALRWHLVFNWARVPKRELLRTKGDVTAPIRTPSHVGCAFSIDREFFFEIGSYDEKMDIWGSENVELAFRVWMCGGSLEIIPCSRVGHLYRISTYSFNGDAETIKERNNVRLVEVWMDEYKDLFYAANPESKNVSPGDLTERKELRKNLNCKNFRWYLENIYPESTWLKEYTMMGEIRSVSKDMCLDIYTTAMHGKLILWPCHGTGGNQFFAFAKSGELVTVEEICVGIDDKNQAILVGCFSEFEKPHLWDYNNEKQWIVHRASNQCMYNNDKDILLGACDPADNRFRWRFKSTMSKNVMLN